METKKILLFFLLVFLSLSLMGCPSKVNRDPRFVQIIDDEITNINSVTYNHVLGTDFRPENIITDLNENQNIYAIDYNQNRVAIGLERDYIDISESIVIKDFYQLDDDLELITDDNGDYILNERLILVLFTLGKVGDEIPFNMSVTDEDGGTARVSGLIIIVEE